MAKTYALKNGGQKMASYQKNAKKKSTYTKKVVDKVEYEYSMMYANGKFERSTADNLSGASTENIVSCVHTIPVDISNNANSTHARLYDGFKINVENKYEEVRITKMEIKLLFKNVDVPVWFLIEENDLPRPHPELMVQNPKAGYKMIKENNNTLTLTWRPAKGSTDYDYHKIEDFLSNAPLAYIKILQYGIEENATDGIVVDKTGCTIHIKTTLACKGLKTQKATALTETQQNYLNTLKNA